MGMQRGGAWRRFGEGPHSAKAHGGEIRRGEAPVRPWKGPWLFRIWLGLEQRPGRASRADDVAAAKGRR